MAQNDIIRPREDGPTPKAKVKRYRLANGESARIPGLGFNLTNAMLQKDFVIRAIEEFEARSGKHVMGRVVILD